MIIDSIFFTLLTQTIATSVDISCLFLSGPKHVLTDHVEKWFIFYAKSRFSLYNIVLTHLTSWLEFLFS